MLTTLTRAAAVAVLALGLAACSSSDEAEMAAAEAGGAGAGAGAIDQSSLLYFNQTIGDRVFFATDSSDLDFAAQDTLRQQATWLNQNPAFTAVIEGHADERGTREYNLALGARRANSARDFLVAEGVAPSRLSTVTYGKERPVATCSDESCWSQNRRAVTVVAGAPTS